MGQPSIDLDLESRVQRCVVEAHEQAFLRSCHDCAEGGVGVALAEAAIWGNVGFRIDSELIGRADAALFGERPSRFIVTLAETDFSALQLLATSHRVGLRRLGIVCGDRLMWTGAFDTSLSVAASAWRRGLEAALVGAVEVNAPPAD